MFGQIYLAFDSIVAVVEILFVDFAAMAVAAVGIVCSATKVDVATIIVVETLFDLWQTMPTVHLDLADDFPELKYIFGYATLSIPAVNAVTSAFKFSPNNLLDAALFMMGIFGMPLAAMFALFGWPLCCCC